MLLDIMILEGGSGPIQKKYVTMSIAYLKSMRRLFTYWIAYEYNYINFML